MRRRVGLARSGRQCLAAGTVDLLDDAGGGVPTGLVHATDLQRVSVSGPAAPRAATIVRGVPGLVLILRSPDYASNVALYLTFQRYSRTHKSPLLAAWGNDAPFFLIRGAEAFARGIRDADIRLFGTGHFAWGPTRTRSPTRLGNSSTRARARPPDGHSWIVLGDAFGPEPNGSGAATPGRRRPHGPADGVPRPCCGCRIAPCCTTGGCGCARYRRRTGHRLGSRNDARGPRWD